MPNVATSSAQPAKTLAPVVITRALVVGYRIHSVSVHGPSTGWNTSTAATPSPTASSNASTPSGPLDGDVHPRRRMLRVRAVDNWHWVVLWRVADICCHADDRDLHGL